MPSRLTDGNPLTYDWLNLLVEDIQSLTASIKPVGDSKKVLFYPRHLNLTGGSVQVVTGTLLVTLKKKAIVTTSSLQSFTPVFASKEVLVIPVAYTSPEDDVFVRPVNVTESGCSFRVRKLGKADSHNSTPVTIKYIAIGQPVSVAS